MSSLTNILMLEVPEHICPGNIKETLKGNPLTCNYCKGSGKFSKERIRDTNQNEICPVCLGAGEVFAEIQIIWKGTR